MRYSVASSLEHSTLLMYALSGTLLMLLVVLLVFLVQQRKTRLNWYDRNLLEIATSPPNYVRCKALPRLDTDDDRDGEPPTSLSRIERFVIRKQSRIHEVNRHSFEVNLPVKEDMPFTVPKMLKNTNSMFNSLDQSQIDRGLYQTNMDSETGYDEESCGCCGSIKLGIVMDLNLNLLTVNFKQAINLIPKRQDGYPNPYFKVALDIPDSPLPKMEQSSKTYKATASPVINEEFFFQISSGNVSPCRLEVMVYDFDQFSVDECIGYCWLTLGRLSISSNKTQPTVFWAEVMPLLEDDNVNGFGEVLFSLTYLSKAQRLTVNVFKARNLRTENIDNLSSNAIRITLMTNNEKRLKRKKTSSKKNAKNPQFNESLTFGIPKNSLCDTILQIENYEMDVSVSSTNEQDVSEIETKLSKQLDTVQIYDGLASFENGSKVVSKVENDNSKMSKAEKRARQILMKLNLERVHGISKVVMRQKPDLAIIFENPEVYRYKNVLSDNYLIFGKHETRSLGLWPGLRSTLSSSPSTVEYLLNPDYAKYANNRNAVESATPIIDENDSGDISERDIDLVMGQSGCTKQVAVSALREANGDLVTAILSI